MVNVLEREIVATTPVIIDDERLPREELARFLRNRGFVVAQAPSGELGIRLVQESESEVVLIDIQLGEGEIDGIDIAHDIQRSYPHISIIFVTAYVDQMIYRQRVQDSGIRVAGWIEKPVMEHLDELVRLIGKEAAKARARKAIAAAEMEGANPFEYLQALAKAATTLNTTVYNELLRELDDRSTMNIEAQIGALYDCICELALRPPDAAPAGEIESLVKQLRVLQRREAHRMEHRFNAQLLIKPGEGYRALRESEELLEEQK